MYQAFGMMVVASLLVSAAAQVVTAAELRKVRLLLEALGRNPVISSHTHGGTGMMGTAGSPAGYAIYVYRAGRWELESDLSAPGYEPSSPTLRGAYEGQVIKKESAPAPGR